MKEGTFAAMEGTVEVVTDPRAGNPDLERILNESRDQVETTFGPGTVEAMLALRVLVTLTIFGRAVPVELQAHQLELIS